jgi:hypothetical protein
MAKRLTKLQVDEVSVVDKGANNKRFLILKAADPNRGSDDPGSIKKADQPPLLGRAREALRKVAGTSGRTDGGTEMTPEDVKKAVAEAAAEILAPLNERLSALEVVVAKAEEGEPDPVPVDTTDAAEEVTLDSVKKIVAETVGDLIAPIGKRLEVVETAAGQRQSALDEQGAHTVRKADGSFSWEGSGLLL